MGGISLALWHQAGKKKYALHICLFKGCFLNYLHTLKSHLNFLLDPLMDIAIIINIC